MRARAVCVYTYLFGVLKIGEMLYVKLKQISYFIMKDMSVNKQFRTDSLIE